MDGADRLAVARARAVARGIGAAVALAGSLAVAGWLLDSQPLAAFGPAPVAPMRMDSAVAFVLCGLSMLAAAGRARRAQYACALLAAGVAALVVVASVTGAAVSPYGLVRRLGVSAPTLEAAAPDPVTASAVIIGLLAAALLLEPTRPRGAAVLSGLAGTGALLALVDRVGALTARTAELRPSIAAIVVALAAAAGVHAVLADRAGMAHALWGEASMRARLLRGFVLPLPFLLAAPAAVAFATVDDPEHARVIARWSIATIPAVTLVSALVGGRIARRTVGQLRTLSDATRALASGEFGQAPLVAGDDEVGQLAAGFEAMRAQLQRRTELEAVVREAVHAVTAPPDLASAFEALGEVLARHLPNDRAAFSPYQDGELVVAAVHGPCAWRLPTGTRLPVTSEMFRPAVVEGRPVNVPDTGVPGGGPTLERLRDAGFRSFVSVPVVLRGETRAFVSLAALRPEAFSDADAGLLAAIVREAGGSLVTLALLDTERETARRLRELDALKDEFVGVVAHDLRSPMTVISGYVDLVLSRWDSLPDQQKRELLESASRGTKRLSALVEDVLTVARIESGSFPIEPRPFDLAGLIQRTVGEFTVSHPDRDVEAVVPVHLPRALGDEDRLWQVLTNLVSNALKFSPADAPVVVSAGTDGDLLAVRVRDQGVGVAPEDLPRLFRKFSRIGRPVSERTTGNGLGLYISRALVEAQGGSISMSSAPDEGSCVTFTVPIAKEEP